MTVLTYPKPEDLDHNITDLINEIDQLLADLDTIARRHHG